MICWPTSASSRSWRISRPGSTRTSERRSRAAGASCAPEARLFPGDGRPGGKHECSRMPWAVEERKTDRGTCHTLIEVLHTGREPSASFSRRGAALRQEAIAGVLSVPSLSIRAGVVCRPGGGRKHAQDHRECIPDPGRRHAGSRRPRRGPRGRLLAWGWQAPYVDDVIGRLVTEGFADADGFLLGRKTYDIFANYWPKVADPNQPIATALNSRPKYVVSRRL